MGEILRATAWPTNAHMIADVAKLGYLDGTVFDATYGEGAFWNEHTPACFLTNDLHKPAFFRHSYRDFPFNDAVFDSVVFDPPYKLQGTPALGTFDARYGLEDRVRETPDDFDKWYGTASSVPWQERMEDIRLGALECWRITRRYLLVKCQDQVCSGKMRWQTDLVTRAVEDAGGRKIDRFDLLRNPRPQPGNRRRKHASSNYSTLLIFGRT